MAKLVCRGKSLGFTILPYSFSLMKTLQRELLTYPSDEVLGYVTHNEDVNERKFIYTESGRLTEVSDHWALDILKEFPYVEEEGPWIVYTCSPERAEIAFQKISSNEALRIHNWDTWYVKGKEDNVAVITSWEIF